MEVMITNVTRMFSDFWPSLQPHYPLLPPEIAAASLSEQEIHLRIVVQELYRENHELRAALATCPVQPAPAVDYSAQVAAKQGQAIQMQAALHSMARVAQDLLKGLQECSLALTVKTQPISAQLQQVSREI